jgi:hypothetical protein
MYKFHDEIPARMCGTAGNTLLYSFWSKQMVMGSVLKFHVGAVPEELSPSLILEVCT